MKKATPSREGGIAGDARDDAPTVSLIATLRDEADNVGCFLEALQGQTRTPDEIILSDGGSTDGTVAAIREAAGRGAPLQLVVAPGANIAQGRNLAIARARGEIIACTDAGCRAHPRWLEEITSPFADPAVDVACGITRADTRSGAEQSLGMLLTEEEGKVDIRTYSPSSRSVAFRRRTWEAVGGYPEELPWAEDTLFNERLRRARARFVLCPGAVVFWRPPATLAAAARKLFRYGFGDGLARLRTGAYLRILAKVFLFLGLAVAGSWIPACWGLLLLLLLAYALRLSWIHRHRGTAGVRVRFCLVRTVLEPVRLLGYLTGRWGERRKP